MNDDPLKNLIKELGSHLSEKEHSDTVLKSGEGKQFEITPSEFEEITKTDTIRKTAFVDGGNGVLYEAPNILINLNRIYFSIFKGKTRIKPKSNPRIQFFSSVIPNVHIDGVKKKVSYITHLFAYDGNVHLPSESDLTSHTDTNYVMQVDRLGSISRRFAEWQMASDVVENELESGDVIIMDGSLQTGFKNEIKYAKKLYEVAMEKNVTVCGLAKTSRLITESGVPLMARISEIAERGVSFGRWYVKVAESVSIDDRGFMFAIKLHEKSPYIFRFEILREQYEKMSKSELNSILYGLATNSQDMAMVGYPYGALDADRFAQVRNDELGMYRGLVMSEMLKDPKWKKRQKYINSMNVHDILNKVTS